MKSFVTPDEALALILERVHPLDSEVLAGSASERLETALGRTLAADVISRVDLPPFDNSAMDGYAVLASDVSTASESNPVRLHLLGTVAAGDVPSYEVTAGNCLKIMTGAPVPPGTEAVIMREETRAEGDDVEFLASARAGQNIRLAGSDVRQGETVLRAGKLIEAAQWSMLAALGAYDLTVFRRPRVAILVTGEELAGPGEDVGAGHIRESNSFALRALVEQSGAEVVHWCRTGDSLEELEAALREAAPLCDAVITSGGVSAGDFDPVRDVLHAKAQVHFWKVAMKPGKPVLFADFEGVPVFGLPGNPVSVMVAFEVFVRPALLKMAGRRALTRVEVPATLLEGYKSPQGRVEFVRAHVNFQNGRWEARIQGDQGSGRLSTMINANALLVVPEEVTVLQSGDEIQARLLNISEVD